LRSTPCGSTSRSAAERSIERAILREGARQREFPPALVGRRDLATEPPAPSPAPNPKPRATESLNKPRLGSGNLSQGARLPSSESDPARSSFSVSRNSALNRGPDSATRPRRPVWEPRTATCRGPHGSAGAPPRGP
jgi:hypothetical protein